MGRQNCKCGGRPFRCLCTKYSKSNRRVALTTSSLRKTLPLNFRKLFCFRYLCASCWRSQFTIRRNAHDGRDFQSIWSWTALSTHEFEERDILLLVIFTVRSGNGSSDRCRGAVALVRLQYIHAHEPIQIERQY